MWFPRKARHYMFKSMTLQITHVEYVPLASVATRRFEDTVVTKDVLSRLEKAARLESAFLMSADAQFAMGWWFYTIQVRPAAVQSLLDHGVICGNGASAADALISHIQADMKDAKCDVRVKRASTPSIFTSYWAWLMK